MNDQTRGAWIMHHTQKMKDSRSDDFSCIEASGKCGILLSAISASDENRLTSLQLESFAAANGINKKIELPTLLGYLKNHRLIDSTENGTEYSVLGISSSSILKHTSNIYNGLRPDSCEHAVIDLSEECTNIPTLTKDAIAHISDKFEITNLASAGIIQAGKSIGFFDSEVNGSDEVLFNGNLFRKNDNKLPKVIASLSQAEATKITELNDLLDRLGCITESECQRLLGDDLFLKIKSIGLIDSNEIGNETGKYSFVTKPSSFSKFTHSLEDDALDLAKAFVVSLSYGIRLSSSGRGKISMIDVLMNKLIAGREVGPATAIGNDYRILELKGVIKVTPVGGGMFMMKLLKPEVGKLALSVLKSGSTIAQIEQQLIGANVTSYKNPEISRFEVRKKKLTPSAKGGLTQLLNDIRTGGLK